MDGPKIAPLEALAIEEELVRADRLCNQALLLRFKWIVAFDEAEAWRADYCTSMADWLCYRSHHSRETANEYARAAHALTELPAIAEAFGDGLLSEDQLYELVKFATPEDDHELAREAPGWSVTHIRMRARMAREITREDDETTHEARELRKRWDHRTGMLRFWGKLPPDQGAVFEKVIDEMATDLHRNHSRDSSYRQCCADALSELASAKTGSLDPDRANVVVHVTEHALSLGRGNGVLEEGVPVSMDTVRRLSCDGRLQFVFKGEDRRALGISRMRRKIPAWLERELRLRDQTCRFQGCENDKFLHTHHVTHWADGGRTDEDNLIMLCSKHHRFLHEGGGRAVLTSTGRILFVRADGRPLAGKPALLRPPLLEGVCSRGP